MHNDLPSISTSQSSTSSSSYLTRTVQTTKPVRPRDTSQSRFSLTVPNPTTTAKTMVVSEKVFRQIEEFIKSSKDLKEIARGKAKKIFASPDKDIVVIAPTAEGKMKEINDEVKTSNTIKERLAGSPHESGLPFLNVHFENYQQSGDLNLLQMRKADGDLEKAVLHNLSIDDRLKMCEQIVSGLSALHSIGYVHGDLKPENVLFFSSKNDGVHVEISDFGKAASIRPDEKKLYKGNPRFTAPEDVLSQKAEVYTAGLLLIRVLEEAILRPTGETKPKQDPGLELSMDTDQTPYIRDDTSLPDTPATPSRTMIVPIETLAPSKVHPKRRGIEQKLIQEGLRRENSDKAQDVYARVDAGKAFVGMSTKQSHSQKIVHNYIKCLVKELKQQNPTLDADQLERTLCNMTLDNPSERPTMEQALMSIRAAVQSTKAATQSTSETATQKTSETTTQSISEGKLEDLQH